MKTLTELDTKLEPFNEMQVDPNRMPTIRHIIQLMLNNSTPKNNDDSLDISQILLKLKQEGDVALENGEFRLVVDKFNANEPKMVSGYHSPVISLLRKCDRESDAK